MCLENIQDLDTLFKEWRKKHESEERGTRYTDTFPYKKDYTCSDDFNKSFCYDGFIEYNKDYEKTILFILREANISDKLKGKELHPAVIIAFVLIFSIAFSKDTFGFAMVSRNG